MTCQLENEESNSVITPFVIQMVFQHVGLLLIINNNKYLKFEMNVQVSQWMDKSPWYNITILTKLNGQIFKDYFRTVCKDMYELMCAVYVYAKIACTND